MPDDAADPRQRNAGSLPGPERIGNARGFVRHLHRCSFSIRSTWRPFIPARRAVRPRGKLPPRCLALAGVSTAAIVWRRRCPYCFCRLVLVFGRCCCRCWVWFMFAGHAMADRYMYLPGIGLYDRAGLGTARLAAGSPDGRWVLATCAAMAIAAAHRPVRWQTSFWRDDETLWRHALACTADNGKAEFGLADALARQARSTRRSSIFAGPSNIRTIRRPSINLGVLLAQQGRLDEAIDQYRQALAIEPDSSGAHVNLGMALTRQQQFDEARDHFRRALEIDPLGLEARCCLGHLLLLEQRIDEARAEFEKAVATHPRCVAAHDDLAAILLRQGRMDASIRHSRAALALDPNFFRAHINLARALAASGQAAEAAAHYRRALELDPNNQVARRNLDDLLSGVQ